MAKSRTEKAAAYDGLLDRFQRMKSVVIAGYSGLSVKDVTTLRNDLRASKIDMVVSKKTVLKRVLTTVDLDPTSIDSVVGEIALVFGYEDEVAPAKILATFAKTHDSLALKGAYVDGQFVDAAGAKALAKLPSRDELRGKLVWVIGSPVTGLVNVFAGSLRSLLNVMNARHEKLSTATN